MGRRVRIICPDNPAPSGGVRQLYHMAELLIRMGHTATILHLTPGFELKWFPHSVPVEHGPQISFAPDDWLVIPEEGAFNLVRQLRGCPKVIYNQNAYCTFVHSPPNLDDPYCPYVDPEVKGTIVISEDSARYLAYAFPRARIFRHFYDYDPDGIFSFVPQEQKKPQIAFMPRRNAGDAKQVLEILRRRGSLAGWRIQVVDGMPPPAVARVLKESAIFFSFGHPEGCPFPPAEAMLCGCIVIGYHGNGAREYLTAERGYSIDVGQILEYVQTAESVIATWRQDKKSFSEMCRKTHDFIRATYNSDTEWTSAQRVWNEIFSTSV